MEEAGAKDQAIILSLKKNQEQSKLLTERI